MRTCQLNTLLDNFYHGGSAMQPGPRVRFSSNRGARAARVLSWTRTSPNIVYGISLYRLVIHSADSHPHSAGLLPWADSPHCCPTAFLMRSSRLRNSDSARSFNGLLRFYAVNVCILVSQCVRPSCPWVRREPVEFGTTVTLRARLHVRLLLTLSTLKTEAKRDAVLKLT